MRLPSNIGLADRAIRITLGVAAIAVTDSLTGVVAVMAWVVGSDALLTGAFGFSLFYDTFGFDTRPAAIRNARRPFAS